MPWVADGLYDHPKTKLLARLLNISRNEAIGTLINLWSWTLKNSRNDEIDNDPTDIAVAAHWQRRFPTKLVEALLEAGFLEKVENKDKLIVHDWYDYAGKILLKKEEYNVKKKEAMRRLRASQKGVIPASPVVDKKEDSAPGPAPTKPPKSMPITEEMQAWANEKHLTFDLERSTMKMLAHYREKGYKSADWEATWQKWMLGEITPTKEQASGRGYRQGSKSTQSGVTGFNGSKRGIIIDGATGEIIEAGDSSSEVSGIPFGSPRQRGESVTTYNIRRMGEIRIREQARH
jgi:hypothetical protein